MMRGCKGSGKSGSPFRESKAMSRNGQRVKNPGPALTLGPTRERRKPGEQCLRPLSSPASQAMAALPEESSTSAFRAPPPLMRGQGEEASGNIATRQRHGVVMASQKVVELTIRRYNFNVSRGVPAAVERFLRNRQQWSLLCKDKEIPAVNNTTGICTRGTIDADHYHPSEHPRHTADG